MNDERFGKIVTDAPTPDELEAQEIERQIQEAELSLTKSKIILNVPDGVFHRLEQAASFHNHNSVEAYCTQVLMDSLNTKVGAPHINRPGIVSGTPTGKITGPSAAYFAKREMT